MEKRLPLPAMRASMTVSRPPARRRHILATLMAVGLLAERSSATCICAVRTPREILVAADSLSINARYPVCKVRALDAHTVFAMAGASGDEAQGDYCDRVVTEFATVCAHLAAVRPDGP